MKNLFDYQVKNVNDVLASFEKGANSTLLISLMGTGKTVMAASIIYKYIYSERRALFLVDLTCLLDQVSKELWSWRVPYSVLQGDRNYDPTMPCTVASIQTIDARMRRHDDLNLSEWLGKFDLIILDEAHTTSYREAMVGIRETYLPKANILGMTATPWRLNSEEYLGQFYDSCVVGMQPPELIKIGKAVPCRIQHFSDFFDLNKISLGKDGDYLESDMEKQAVSAAHLEKVYTEWEYWTPGAKTIAFCSSVNHAKVLCDYFNDKGVPSGVIHAKTSHEERQSLFRRLKSGEIKMLSSVDTLTAGFDEPSVTCILFVRITKSKARYHQAGGRAARVYPGKDFYYILDFGNNCKQHGSPMSYQDYSISRKDGAKKEKLKLCPNCHNWVSVFSRLCPECGHEFVKEKEEKEEKEFYQTELDMPMVEFFSRDDCERLIYYRTEKQKCFYQNLSPDTAGDLFYERYGYRPPHDWALQAVFGTGATKSDTEKYRAYLEQFAPHDFWIKIQMKYEFGDTGAKRSTKKETKRKQAPAPRYTPTINWFDVLDVSPSANESEVKIAYRRLASQWHPDICKDDGAESKMKQINWAYEYYRRHFSTNKNIQSS